MRVCFIRHQPPLRFHQTTERFTGLSPRCSGIQSNDGITFDIKKYVDETERNIVELNKSRLKALEDVNNERILRLSSEHKLAALEDKLEQMEEEITTLKQKLKQSINSPLQEKSPEAEKILPEAQPINEESPDKDPPVNEIILHYRTSWRNAYIHFKLDSKGWTKTPGMKMENHEKEKYIKLEGNHLEFVLNNGRDDWDKPFIGDDENALVARNYKITSSGEYILHNGLIQRCE